jgi:LmeA-like phospholipid-binding
MRKLLIAPIALAALIVGADRVAVAVAEHQISDQIATAYGLSAKPGVSIAGFPFLTQALTGDYQQVTISANQVQAGGATLRHLRVSFTGVHASLGQVLGHGPSTVTADHATGSATVTFATVDQRLPRGLRVKPDGSHLTLAGRVPYHGGRVPVSARVNLGVSWSGIRVTPAQLTSPGQGVPTSAYSSRLSVTVPLSALPLHLRLTSVHVTRAGLRIGASARNVYFTRA